MKLPLNSVFFGTDEFAVQVLETLAGNQMLPALIVTTPDRPRGRHLRLTPSPVKLWARDHSIPYLQPEKLSDSVFLAKLKAISYNLFLVASYGKILSQSVIDLPTHGTLNLHPSLLPRHRGATPIQAAILNGETETGVTIISLDAQMDHGPILARERWSLTGQDYPHLRDESATLGAKLFIKIIPDWLAGKLKTEEQDHTKATYTKKIKKEDGEIILSDDPELNYRKFLAHKPWPGTYFFAQVAGARRRFIIKSAKLIAGQLVIERVIPEGKQEIDWTDYRQKYIIEPI